MTVLFFMRSTVYVRNFESTLRRLAERGHQVHVVADTHEFLDPSDLIGRLCRQYPGITHSGPPRPQAPYWTRLGVEFRKAIDYVRYLEPEYGDAPKLRMRAELTAPVFMAFTVSRQLARTRVGRAIVRRGLRAANRAIPTDPAISAFIADQKPDVVLVTPLVEPGSPQSEYLRAARQLGIRTALCVYSWDNLTSKGLIHDPLDLVTVWNEPMKQEAVALHGVPAERVVVTGDAAHDHWFTWQSRSTRETFCSRVGLDADRPYLLYLCSSRFIAPNEAPFVRRWVQEVRAASPLLREAGVLIRPHPQNMERWRNQDLTDLGDVTLWPRRGANPTDEETRSDYYDSIAYSAAVVGINTTALIESAIVGRGVYTVLAPEFRDTQEGTLHFRLLRNVSGGLLHVAADMQEHVRHLEAALRDPQAAAGRCRGFVEAFIRPYGRDEPAAPRLVSAIETVAARGAARRDCGPWWTSAVRPVLVRVATSIHKRLRALEREDLRQRKAKRVDQAERARRRAAAEREAAAVALSASMAFEHYVRVRDHLRAFQPMESVQNGLMPRERCMVAALQPLWDASPEAMSDWRRYRETISGIRAADYVGEERSFRAAAENDARRLLARGDSRLWVDEPAVFGGFGFITLGKRYNEDTLRFFRAISLLQDAALMKEFRSTTARRIVWEVGGGWGGFAYHFKTLCPNVTYLMTGKPEQFLVSAVYLMTLFPAAAFRFYDPADPDAFWRDWESVDFAFAPECVVRTMTPPSLDLTVDVMALERMNSARLDLHVQRAYDLGSRHFLSVGAVAGDDEVMPVLPGVERLYWRHPVSAPESLARRLSLSTAEGQPERTYFLGWKRLRP
jgi:hypothetical protein